jgi:hypothetical protein
LASCELAEVALSEEALGSANAHTCQRVGNTKPNFTSYSNIVCRVFVIFLLKK